MQDPPTFRTLFAGMPATAQAPSTRGPGVFADVALRELIATNQITADTEIADDQIQPASVDLRLGRWAYRVRASFLPGEQTVMDKLSTFTMHRIDLEGGAVLERGCVYIVPLMERLQLQGGISALTNPKSSTGRLDIFTRVITDRATAFDKIDSGYRGPLFLEVAPRTFSVLVRPGVRLSQIRFQRGSDIATGAKLRDLHKRVALIGGVAGEPIFREGLVGVTVDLDGDAQSGLVGYRAKKHADVIDVDRRRHYEIQDFWEPIRTRTRRLILDPDDFYILVTREWVTIPPDHAAEMVAYDTMVGEFRVHYAGFFDPGFGHGGDGVGSRAVLEVRSHEVPFLLEHGQTVGWLRYERLTAPPARLYGAGSGSNYQRQGLQLAKQFKLPP
jgi:dCTP deaminase